MKKIWDINLLAIKYTVYKCPLGKIPYECPNIDKCGKDVVENGYSDCIYIKKPK